MRNKLNGSFGYSCGKVNIGKRLGRSGLGELSLKRGERMNNCFVVKTVETQTEVALGFQEGWKPIKGVQWKVRIKFCNSFPIYWLSSP